METQILHLEIAATLQKLEGRLEDRSRRNETLIEVAAAYKEEEILTRTAIPLQHCLGESVVDWEVVRVGSSLCGILKGQTDEITVLKLLKENSKPYLITIYRINSELSR